MKKLRIYKLLQTAILFLAAVGICIINLFLGDSPETQLFFNVFFWVLLVFSFACVLIDLRFFANIDTGSYRLRLTAYVDPLTGVMNRTGMDLLLSRIKEQGQLPTLGCVAFQLDNLYDTNDTKGHDAGDQLVRRFGALLSGTFGQSGYICRNNAVTFFAVVPNCDENRLRELCHKAAQSIEQNNDFSGNPYVEFSSGSAVNVAEHCSSASDLLSTAYKRIPRG